MADISIGAPSGSSLIDTDPGLPIVKVRAAWSGAWETVPYLEAIDKAFNRVAPAKSEARLLWRYGKIKREDASSFAAVVPKDLFGKYVRIDVSNTKGTTPRWYGVIDDDQLEIRGKTPEPTGDQALAAYGLEHLLDRYALRKAKYTVNGTDVIEIERIPSFNRKAERGGSLIGNRSTATTDENVDAFSSDGSVWTNKQIIASVLKWNLPADAPPFTLAGQVEALHLIEDVHEFHSGMSLREVLNKLIDRRRGLGWVLRIGENDEVNIWVYTVLEKAVKVGAAEVPANAEQATVTLDEDRAIAESVVMLARSARYNRLVVRGGLLKCIFSVAPADANFQKGWENALLSSYKDGAKADPNYSAQDERTKAHWNDEVRGDDRFDRLGLFRIPANWDKLVAGGEGGVADYIAIPACTDYGSVNAEAAGKLFTYGKALLQHLPAMEVGKDYSHNPATDENPSDAEPEYRRPFVVVWDTVTERYVYLDKLAERPDATLPNATIRAVDREMALQIDMRPRHLLFKADWSGAEPGYFGNKLFDAAQVLDWNDLIATVALEADEHIRYVVQDGEGDRELVLDLPDAEFVYLAPFTVVGLNTDGGLKYSPAGGVFIRDDSQRLETLAALAWAWYSVPRASVRITKKSFAPILAPGSLVKAVQAGSTGRDVGTIVTEEAIDWKARTVGITTNYQTFEFGDFGPGIPSRHAAGHEIRALKKKTQELNERTGGLPTRIGGGGGAGGGGGHVAVKAACSNLVDLGATVDGVSIATGERVLVFGSSGNNGVYERVGASAFNRTLEFTSANVDALVAVGQGTNFGKTFFLCTAVNTLTKMGAYFT